MVRAEPVARVPGRGGATFRLQQLLGALPRAVVAGVPSVSRAVMNRAKGGALELFAEGTNLKVPCQSIQQYRGSSAIPWQQCCATRS